MTHLSTLDLAAEVDRLVDPSASPEDQDARIVSHLRDCGLCRERVSTLRDQDMQLARALHANASDVPELSPEVDVSSQVAAMMKRLRADVAANRGASERTPDAEPLKVPQKDARARAQHPWRARRATIGVLSFAAGVGFALLLPAMSRTFTTPAGTPVALVPGNETIRDSVPGFEGKQYAQKVGAGSAVHLVVQGINRSDFDCELYDPTQAKPVAVDNGIGNSCEFSIVASAAGEYRLVLKNRVGAATSYMMVAQVVSKGQSGAGRIVDLGAIPDEALHQIQ